MMNANGMSGQFGYGFPNQGNMAGMGFNNGMNPMNGMSNMMGNMPYNMNPMGTYPSLQSRFPPWSWLYEPSSC
jgi:hypothetical protein